jgi:hypothetical protein
MCGILLPKIARLAATAACCVALLTSCAQTTLAPVQTDVAEAALEAALDSWKEGKKPDDLNEEKPPIICQDVDWLAGAKLLSYSVQPDPEKKDSTMYAKVKLSLEAADGKKTEKNVTYMVGTDPKLTVFRAFQP